MSTILITKRKLEILLLLYRFRFLNTNQIQKLLHHKNPTRIQIWLQELTKDGYIFCYYNRYKIGENNKPAIYCLATKSKKELQKIEDCDDHLLIRIYKEKEKSLIFKQRHILIADMYITFMSDKGKSQQKHFSTATDLVNYEYFPHPLPDAYIAVQEKKDTNRYFIEFIDANMKRSVMRSKIKKYFKYISEGDWQAETDEAFPAVLVVCPDTRRKKVLNKFIAEELDRSYETDLSFYLTLQDELKKDWMKIFIWEEVTIDN